VKDKISKFMAPGSCSFVSNETTCVLCGSNNRAVLSPEKSVVTMDTVDNVAKLLEEKKRREELEAGTEEDQTSKKEVSSESLSTIVTSTPKYGICEPCAVFAYWKWRDEPAEVPPGFDVDSSKRVTRVHVLVPRLVTPKTPEEKLSPFAVESYECLMVASKDHFDLPGLINNSNALPDTAAAKTVLAQIGIVSWVPFLETLYRGYTPRGHLVSVVLATAWALDVGVKSPRGSWRKLPVRTYVDPGLTGFYEALTEVLQLRMFKYQHQSTSIDRPFSIQVRKGAAEYLQTKHDLREVRDNPEKAANIDISMMPLLRKAMSLDEQWVDRVVAKWEDDHSQLTSQKKKQAEEAAELVGQVSSGLEDESNEDTAGSDDDEGGVTSQDAADSSTDDDSDGHGDRGDTPKPVVSGPIVLRPVRSPAPSSDDEEEESWPVEVVSRAVAEGKAAPEGFVRRGTPLTTEKPK
jgi:hypothetical protein